MCPCYLDDVIIISDTFEAHIELLRLVSERLRTANLTLKPSTKCLLMSRVINENGKYFNLFDWNL